MTHYGRPAYDPINSLYVICGDDGNVYSWAIGDVSVALEHAFGGTIKCRGVFWSNIDQRLYAITEDSGSGDFGHFTNRTGTWSWNSLDTTYAFLDFHVNSTATRLFALKSNGDLGLYSIASDGSLTELDTLTPGTGELPSGTIVAVTFREGQGYYAQYNDGSVGYLVEEDDLSGDWFTILTSAHAAGSPGLALSNSSLFGYACTLITAADHIVRFPFDDEDLGTSDVIDKGAVGDTLRGLAMARIGIAPPTDAPSGLTATAAGATTVDLAWTDNATGETGQRIAWSDDGWATTNFIIVAADETTYSHTGRTAETEYCYKIQAFNASGSSEYSNIDCATTAAAPSEVIAIAVQNISVDPDGIILVDYATLTDITRYDITGEFSTLSYTKPVAYHSGIDRFLYGTDDGELRSVQWTGSVWQNDTLAHDFGTGVEIRSISFVAETGAVTVVTTAERARWASGEINVDTTWDSPGTYTSATGIKDVHAFWDGTQECWSQVHSTAAEDIYLRAPYTTQVEAFTPTSGASSGAVWDKAAGLVRYRDDTLISRCLDTTPFTVTNIVTNSTRGILQVYDSLLWHAAAPDELRTCDPMDGTGNTTVYAPTDAADWIVGFEITTLA
jgi:hypothetical protein